MTEPMILTEHVGDVLVIRLNRSERLNAAPPEMFDDLMAAMSDPEDARAVLITGNDRGFCSGADLSGRGERAPGDGATFMALNFHYNPTMLFLADYDLPIVSAVNGPAAGIGCSLALAADFCVAGEKAYFLQAFVNIGLVPDGGSSWMLPRLIGKARATEMMMLGEKIPGAKAADWGLIHRCVPDAEVYDTALALAARLAAGPTMALGAMRRNLHHALQSESYFDALGAEAYAQHEMGGTDDAVEGTMAFLQKRKAQFKGQ